MNLKAANPLLKRDLEQLALKQTLMAPNSKCESLIFMLHQPHGLDVFLGLEPAECQVASKVCTLRNVAI